MDDQTQPRGLLGLLAHPVVDRWLPEGVADSNDKAQLLRTRILATLMMGLGALSVAFATFDVVSGLYALSIPLWVGAIVALSGLLAIRSTGDLEWVGGIMSAGMFLVVVVNGALNDGLEAPVLMFLALVPVFPLVFGDRRRYSLWLPLVMLTIVGIFVAESAGFGFWQTMDLEMVPLNLALVLVALYAAVYGTLRLQIDLSEWLRERLVEAEAQRTRRILDAAGDAILLVDHDARIITANAASRGLFGRDVLAGVDARELLRGESDLLTHGTLRRDAIDGDQVIPVDATVSPLDNGHVLVLRDIREHLDIQRDLEAARDDATASSQAKSRFLASMSHELRTPLNAVIGYAEMLIDDIEAGVAVEDPADLHRIVGSAQHLLALIDQVLDLAKVEAGRMELELRDLPLDPILEELERIGRTLASANSNTFVFGNAAAGVHGHTDEVRLKQVVLNLLSNAAKFTENGTITLEVSRDGDTLVIRVEDTGIGMSEAQQARIWEEFVQAETSTTRRFGGTGLGLSLARHITELLGGDLTLWSEEGVGTRFDLVVPLRPEPENG